jgi:hypothetical protein
MRQNSKTVVKNYDTDEVNGWLLSYEYESQNGALPGEIRVTGTKGVSSLYISKTDNNISVNFGGGSEFDTDVIDSVKAECEAITVGFTADK